jgi:hypothetical protein
VSQYQSLADALETEVLSEMAETFFGARKALEDLTDDLMLCVESLRVLSSKVFARVLFLRSLLLGEPGEAAFFAALGLPPQFPMVQAEPGVRVWKPDSLPFAFLPSSRFAEAVLLAYGEIFHACEVYMVGEYEDDPEQKGRKRMSMNYAQVESRCHQLNTRIDKLNADMAPSSVLQYARNISAADQAGQGSITNALGAESLDKGLLFVPVDCYALGLWRAPSLPAPQVCEGKVRAFAKTFYAAHEEQARRVLKEF